MKQIESTKKLLQFIEESPTAFHAVESISGRLTDAGFHELHEGDAWDLIPGEGYYVTRNQSSVLAFRIPTAKANNFLISASHTDSPMFKVKSGAESEACNHYIRLNTEVYGGTILSTWLDRPLTLAGRVVLAENGNFSAKTVKIDRDLLVIPSVAIHFNRTVNSGYAYNPAVDTLPLFAQKNGQPVSLKALIAKEISCDEDQIAQMDLYVCCHTLGTVWGANEEFFSAPRIDNLMCAYGTLQGFLEADRSENAVTVYYAADNEETGSSTKQGAGALVFRDILERIAESEKTDVRRMLASSFMVSADNGHARHPNHPELSDAQNAPYMNEGIVIKLNSSQKYATEALSAALFREICRRAEVPVQTFANRSDMLGGSTLGSISDTFVPLLTVDIGLAQLAMHSCYETAGTCDTAYLIRAAKEFYETVICSDKDGTFTLSQKKSEG